MEKFLQPPRHVEVQVIADGQGNAVHLLVTGTAHCSGATRKWSGGSARTWALPD